MRRAWFLAPLAGACVVVGCASLNDLTGGALGPSAKRNAQKIGENAVASTVRGDLTKSATFTMGQEFYLGKTIAANVVARLGGRILPPDHEAARYVRDVGTTVALASAEKRVESDRPYPWKGYRFLLVDSPQVNAVGMPGGFVAVTTGALLAARSEDELAAILAHEVAHVQRGHAMRPVEKARQQEHMTDKLLSGTDKAVHAFFGKVVTLGADFVLDKGFGKADELEADALAASVLEDVGYDRDALAGFLSRLDGKSARGGFFSRHPPAADRVAVLRGEGKVVAVSSVASPRAGRFATHLRSLD